ncbi:hypothetical protein Droror1_Dr00007920 [Drosera rotundifolia]
MVKVRSETAERRARRADIEAERSEREIKWGFDRPWFLTTHRYPHRRFTSQWPSPQHLPSLVTAAAACSIDVRPLLFLRRPSLHTGPPRSMPGIRKQAGHQAQSILGQGVTWAGQRRRGRPGSKGEGGRALERSVPGRASTTWTGPSKGINERQQDLGCAAKAAAVALGGAVKAEALAVGGVTKTAANLNGGVLGFKR